MISEQFNKRQQTAWPFARSKEEVEVSGGSNARGAGGVSKATMEKDGYLDIGVTRGGKLDKRL